MIVFSPLSSFITISILHLPLSAPELLFLLFIPCFYRTFWPRKIDLNILMLILLIWGAVLAISLIYNTYTFFEILGCSRTYLYICIFFTIFYSNRSDSFRSFVIVSYGAILGWIIDIVIIIITTTMNNDASIGYGPMIAIPIAITYPAITQHRRLAFLIFLGCIFIGIFGALRRVLFISVIVYLCVLIYQLLSNPNLRLKILTVCCISFSALGLSYPLIKDWMHDYSWDLYVRIIVKSEDFFNGKSNSGDDLRNHIISDYFNNFYEYIAPRGFISKQYGSSDTGIYNDFPLMEISYTFGIITIFLLIAFFGFKAILILKRVLTSSLNEVYLIYPIGFLTICILLFLEGSFLTFPYQSIYVGYLLGGLSKYHK